MQEWIIAMLVISVLLILRDMAKTILTGRMSKKEEIFPIGEDHPQKEKVERYAAAFQKLADTFYGMPYRKEYLSSGQIERILTDANDRLCSNCYHREICWGSQAETMCQGGEALVRALEKDDEGELEKLRMQWGSVCGKIIAISGRSTRTVSTGKTESYMDESYDRKSAGSGSAADRDSGHYGDSSK